LNDGRSGHPSSSEVRFRASSPFPASLKDFSEANNEAEEQEGDETIQPVKRSTGKGAQVLSSEGEDDISIQAQARAEKTFEVVKEKKREVEHDEKACTICSGKAKNGKRRQARKERITRQGLASAPLFVEEEGEEEEQLFLSLLEAAAVNMDTSSSTLPRNSKHLLLVQRLLGEHMDEFYHHRLLYCELADELKQYEPSMNKVKRRILAEHVMEAVEGLEFRAKRINVLQNMVGGNRSGEQGVSKEGQRHSKHLTAIVDGGKLYRRVVSA
jgi:hypothetical protein